MLVIPPQQAAAEVSAIALFGKVLIHRLNWAFLTVVPQLYAQEVQLGAVAGFLSIQRLWQYCVRFLGSILLFSLLLIIGACGGGSSGSTTPTPTPTPAPPPTQGGGTPHLPATVIDLTQTATATGIDITVPAPASSTAPNAQNLGVNPTSGQATADNTGGTIHRGATQRIILFGPALSGSMQVRIAGPSDITISNITSIKSTDNTPGISFFAAPASNAALGARSVFLQTANGDVTSFTGGLEVVEAAP
jgi:hypothetical protein